MTKEFFHGLLIPGEWDGEEQIKSFILSCDNEREYFISNTKDHNIIEEYLRKRISVYGEISEHEGRLSIVIDKILD